MVALVVEGLCCQWCVCVEVVVVTVYAGDDVGDGGVGVVVSYVGG